MSKDGGVRKEWDEITVQSEDQAAKGVEFEHRVAMLLLRVWEVGMGREGK